MVSPFALAAMLGRMVKIACPHCRHTKLVSREPAAFRVCPRCHKQFADPLSAKKPKPRR